MPEARERLLTKLQKQSITYGDFVLASGARSNFYFDCKLTTLDPEGAALVGEQMLAMIRAEAQRLGVKIEAIGGLTMGADPIAQSVGLTSWLKHPTEALQIFSVRKTPKAHGRNKLIEGNFREGMSVVVIDDVVTKGDSTIKAIEAVKEAGGVINLVAVLVDREQGGCDRIRALGYPVVALFRRTELMPETPAPSAETATAAK
jgi:orotate phosphoribosyltransferase